jgi:hypothetical protein
MFGICAVGVDDVLSVIAEERSVAAQRKHSHAVRSPVLSLDVNGYFRGIFRISQEREVRVNGLGRSLQLKSVLVGDFLNHRLTKQFEDCAQNLGIGPKCEDSVVGGENASNLKCEVLLLHFSYKLCSEVELTVVAFLI